MKTKKILSLLIVFALAFSFMTITNVQAAYDEFAILKTLGITTDFSDDTTPITRYQLAEIALQLTGSSPSAVGSPVYPDIPVKHKYFPVINVVTSKGLMGATMDGSFAPDSNATAMDGGRLVLAELGYSGFAQQAGWSDLQYMSKVKSLGLTSGFDTEKGLTYSAVGRMLINMLTKTTMEIVSVDTDGIKYAESDLTYIESKYGYVLKRGILQAAGNASMTGYAPLAANRVSIDGVKYSTNGQDFTQYVGYEVQYVLDSKYNDAKIIHIEPYKGYNELVIPSKDIKSVVESGSKYIISYVDETQTEESVSFDNSAMIVFNGQNVTNSAKILQYLNPVIGKITLVDVDSNDVYDTVHVDSSVYYKVGAISEKSISDQYTNNSLSLEDKIVYAYKDGTKSSVDSIEPGTYVEVSTGDIDVSTINGNNIIVPKLDTSDRIIINAIDTTTLSGKVNGLITGKVAIDGTLYEYNKYFEDLISTRYAKSLSLGDVVEVALNKDGEIIDIISTTSDYSTNDNSNLKYGYMFNMIGLSDISEQALVTLMDIDNLEKVKLVTSEDCKLNDKEFKYQELLAVDPTTTATALYYADGTTFKDQLIRYELNEDGEICKFYMAVDRANDTIILPETNYLATTRGSHPYGKPSTHENPDYDPTYAGYDNNNFSLDYMDMAYGHGAHINDLYKLIKGETLILKIPLLDADKENPKKWRVYFNKEITSENSVIKAYAYNAELTARIELYDVSELYVPAVAVTRETVGGGGSGATFDSFGENQRTGVVTSLINIYDEESNKVKTQVTLMMPTPAGVVTRSFIPTSNDLAMATGLNYKKLNPDGTTVNVSGANLPGSNTDPDMAVARMLWTDMQVGDIVQIETNLAGEADKFVLYVSKDMVNNMTYFGNLTARSFITAYYTNVDVGYVTKAYGADGFLMNIEGPTGSVDGLQFVRELNNTIGGKITTTGAMMVYYAGSTKGQNSAIDEVKVGDRVIVHKKNGIPVEIYVIR